MAAGGAWAENLSLPTSGTLTLHIEDDGGIGWPATVGILHRAVELMLGPMGSDSEGAGASREGLSTHTQQS